MREAVITVAKQLSTSSVGSEKQFSEGLLEKSVQELRDFYILKSDQLSKENTLIGAINKLSSVDQFDVKDNLNDLVLFSKQKVKSCLKSQESCESQVMKIVNKLDGDDLDKARFAGKMFKYITINDLCLAFIKGSMWSYQQLNAHLTEEDCKLIHNLVGQYLMHSRERQQFVRLQQKLESMTLEPDMFSESDNRKLLFTLLEECNITINEGSLVIQDRYEMEHYPEWMVFEHLTGMALRDSQIKNLKKLYQEGADSEKICQMIMGAGKSKVLLPLLALKKANGDTLSMVVVPQSLYKDVVHSIQLTTLSVFERHSFTLDFNRNSVCSFNDLTLILDELKRVKEFQHYLVLTSTTIHCLRLKLLEFIHKGEDEVGQVELLQQILRMFRDDGDVLVDEAHIILNTQQEVNFTLDKKQKPDPIHLKCLVKLHRIIKDTKESSGTFTDAVWPFIKSESINFGFSQTFNELLKNDYFNSSIQLFLNGDSFSDMETYSMTVEDKQLLYLLRQEFNFLLELTLSKKLYVDYGPSDNKQVHVAIPYKANNTPNESSRFDQVHELVNYTAQMYMETGVPNEILLEHVELLRKELLNERDKGVKDIKSSESGKMFERLFGIDCQFLEIVDINEIIKKIQVSFSKNVTLLDSYIETHLLSSISIYQDTISSNSYNFVDMFRHVQGFSGTPSTYEATTHHRLTTDFEFGTDGKSIDILLREGAKSNCIKQFDTLETIQFSESMRAFIDVGALFQGISNRQIAERLIEKVSDNIKGIVFYLDNEPMVLCKPNNDIKLLSDISFKPEELFTYYDQYHTTGSDIPQMSNARAIVSVAKSTLTHELFQGMWRLRQIDQNQSFELMLAPDIDSACQTVQDILIMTDKNQSIQEQQQLVQSMPIHAKSKKETDCFQSLLDMSYSEEREAMQGLVKGEIHRKCLDPVKMYADSFQFITKSDYLDIVFCDVDSYKDTSKDIRELYEKDLPDEFYVSSVQGVELLKYNLKFKLKC